MLKSKLIAIVFLAGVGLSSPAALLGQAGPFNGAGELKLSTNLNSISAGDRVEVRVDVDLNNVLGRRGNGNTTPAVLGGYVIQVSFDRSHLRFESARGGAGEFAQEPAYRMPALANASGNVAIAGVQTSSESPSGLVHVATLEFTAIASGAASVSAIADSLSSAFQMPAAGPAGISASGAQLAMGILPSSSIIPAQLPTTIIPVVGSLPGSGGSFFRTSIQLYNGSTAPISGRMLFHPRGVSGRNKDAALNYALAPGQSVEYIDVVAAMGESGLGTLDVVADGGALPVTFARLFNDHGDGGTSGMSIDGISPREALSKGSRTVLLVPSDLTSSRFNVGVRTLGEGATIKVTVADRDGRIIATSSRVYPSDFFDQQGANAMAGTALSGSESLTIELEAGSAIVYGAATDIRTQDPTLQYARLLPVE